MTTSVTAPRPLFAALNVLDGTVINMQRHRHQEFIRFLNVIDAQVPRRKAIHVMSSSTTMPLTNIPRSEIGSSNTLAGPSTSPQLRPLGSMPLRATPPSSPGGASSAACPSPSTTSRPPSIASSRKQTQNQDPLSGPPIQNACSPLSNAGSKR